MTEFPPSEADIGAHRLDRSPEPRPLQESNPASPKKLDNENPRLGDITARLSFGIF
jgi:hypothetical protein